MKHDESKIQSEIVQYLQARGLYFFSVPNERKATVAQMGRLIAMGLRPGVSDLIAFLPNGKPLFIEVKDSKGKQSDKQKRFEKRITELGHIYKVVRSVDDVEAFLNEVLG